MAQGGKAFLGLLAAGLLRQAAAHGWVTEPVSMQDLTYRLRAWGDWQQGMPEALRYEPWSARIAPGASPSSPGDSCGTGAGRQYEQGLLLWEPWFSAGGVPVPTITPGGEVDVTVTFTADHGGQAWFEIACSDTLNENTDWIILERAASDRTVNFLPGLPTICAWGEIGDGCTSIRWMVPTSFRCPTGRVVGRWVWKVGNTCIDADNLGIRTEDFSYNEWQRETGNQRPKCATSPEHFVSCFVFRVEGSGSSPSPTPTPTPTPTPLPSTMPALTTSTVPRTPTCVPIGNCGEHYWCNQAAYTEYCDYEGLKGVCPTPFCKAASSTFAPTPFPPSAPTPVPPTSTTPAPTPVTQGDCVPTNEGLYNNPEVYGPLCKAASSACPAPMCKRAGSMLQARHSKSHSFLGTALIQRGVTVESALGSGTRELEL